MHVNGCFWELRYERYWITANIIECICYFAVPIFFMISGATLLNYRKRYTTAVFFKKRFGKTLVLFLIWSVISAIWYYIVYHTRPEGIREVADGLNSGLAIEDMTYIDGTVYRTRALDDSLPTLILPDFEALRKSPRQYAESFRIQYRNTDILKG